MDEGHNRLLLKSPLIVIPAEAGIQKSFIQNGEFLWIIILK